MSILERVVITVVIGTLVYSAIFAWAAIDSAIGTNQCPTINGRVCEYVERTIK